MNFDPKNAPAAVARLYTDAMEMATDKGHSKPDAQKAALRQVQLGGWYRTDTGWKRIGPDIRDKVNIRQAHHQPDGRYLITDVDVFYPNATKGPDWIFNDQSIPRLCKNTNRMIEAGGQRPALVEGHQHAMIKMMGVQQDALGYAINFRPHPSKSGWARCDLVDVLPQAVDRMRDRKITGLSAEISFDFGKLNGRFARVSLLGGSIQSLSHLPMTEVYSVSDQLCFSAEGMFPSRGQARSTNGVSHMPLKPNQAKDMAECFSAMSAAYAACAAGEEGSEAKLEEAKKQHDEMEAKYGAVTPAAAAVEPGIEDPGMAGDSTAQYSVDEVTPEQMTTDPVGVLMAFQSEIVGLRKESNQHKEQQRVATAAAKKAGDRKTFEAFCGDLHKKGHIFEDAEAVAMFESSGDDEGRLKALSSFLKKTPTKKETGPADISAIFSADDIAPASTTEAAKKTAATASTGALSFSAEENQLGQDVADMLGLK